MIPPCIWEVSFLQREGFLPHIWTVGVNIITFSFILSVTKRYSWWIWKQLYVISNTKSIFHTNEIQSPHHCRVTEKLYAISGEWIPPMYKLRGINNSANHSQQWMLHCVAHSTVQDTSKYGPGCSKGGCSPQGGHIPHLETAHISRTSFPPLPHQQSSQKG